MVYYIIASFIINTPNLTFVFYILTEPTVCPYGPEKVEVPGIRANNYHPRKPVIVEVAPSAVDAEIDEIVTRGDRTPEILAPVKIQNRVSRLAILAYALDS